MSKKFKNVSYPKRMLEDKIRLKIIEFLDKHEATICHEDMSSEMIKLQMAQALMEDLMGAGVTITYMKKVVEKDDREDE